MAKLVEDQLLVPSVFDRLIDHDLDSSQDGSQSRGQLLKQIKENVRRDIENMLNTKRQCNTWDSYLKELNRSVVSYGIPDFTGTSFAEDAGQTELKYLLEEIILNFEPRFESVSIEILDKEDSRQIRFHIKALLRAYPAPEPIEFDSKLEPDTRSIIVENSK